ncbi:MAG: tetratricopeptide repeat protein [Thermoplasmata archaeon]|nr:tetratricopeptide repeat protein [Thermoplasmata archaeon]
MIEQPSFKLASEIRRILTAELGREFGQTVFVTQCSELNIKSEELKVGDLIRLAPAIIRAIRPSAGDETAQRVGNQIKKLKVQMELETLKGKEGDPAMSRRFADMYVTLGSACHATGDFDEADKAFRNAIRYAKKADYPLKDAEAHIGIGLIFERNDKWDDAIEYLNKGLSISQSADYPLGIADASRWLGHLEWHRSNYDRALEWLEKGLSNAERTGDDSLVGQIMIEFGLVYSDRGELPKAIEWFSRSLPLLEGVRDYRQLSRIYNNIGDSHMQQKEWKKALEHFEKSEEYARMINNQQFIGWSLFNSGEALLNINEIDQAIDRADTALKMLEPLHDTMGVQGSIRIQALGYAKKKEWAKAEEMFSRAMEITEGMASKYHKGQLLFDIGRMHRDKGDKKKAKTLLTEAQALFKEIGAKRLLAEVTEDLGK